MPYRYWYERVTGTGDYKKKTPCSVVNLSGESILNRYGAENTTTINTKCPISSEQLTYTDQSALSKLTRGGGITSIENSVELASILNNHKGQRVKTAILLGMLTKNNQIKANIPDNDRSRFSMERYKFFLDAPFEISNMCCNVMKKKPAHDYGKSTGRKPITAQMTDESRLRTQKWVQNGCNAFDLKNPISNPMAFWTEQDVLAYIVMNNLEICSVYGDIVEDYGDEIDGQMCLADYGIGEKNRKFKCTGCRRTGCMLCGFGCHLEKDGESRFQKLHKTHPKMYAILDIVKNNGVTFREAIEWTNEHGNLKILL